MECSICFRIQDSHCMLSCFHEICTECMLTWRQRKNTCPTCRRCILWAKVVGDTGGVESVQITPRSPLGVTLKNNFPGSIIVAMQEQSCISEAGLTLGDVIMMVNSIPAYHHEYTIDLLKDLCGSTCSLIVYRGCSPPMQKARTRGLRWSAMFASLRSLSARNV